MLTVNRFQAAWCQPCRISEPIFTNFVWDNDIDADTIDIDAFPDLAEKHGIKSIPTVVFERDGEEVARLVGPQTSAQLQRAYDNL